MAAGTGRTHSKYLQVWLDASNGTLTNITPYVNSVGQFGLTYDTQDVTALSDGAKNIVVGMPGAPITLSGPIDSVIITHMTAICGTGQALSLDLRMGIGQTPDAADPQFGISMSGKSGYVVTSFTVDPGANTWTATLDVQGATAPAFGTTAET